MSGGEQRFLLWTALYMYRNEATPTAAHEVGRLRIAAKVLKTQPELVTSLRDLWN